MRDSLSTRELHVRLTPKQFEALRTFADTHGLGLNAAARHLVEMGTAPDEPEVDARLDQVAEHVRSLQAVVFAGLLASEHSVKFLELITPDGRHRSAQLALDAAEHARVRLEQVEHWLQEAHRQSRA